MSDLGDVRIFIYPVVNVVYGLEVMEYKGTRFINMEDIEDPLRRFDFQKWLHGCTMPMIPNVPYAVYPVDWIRFHNGLPNDD